VVLYVKLSLYHRGRCGLAMIFLADSSPNLFTSFSTRLTNFTFAQSGSSSTSSTQLFLWTMSLYLWWHRVTDLRSLQSLRTTGGI